MAKSKAKSPKASSPDMKMNSPTSTAPGATTSTLDAKSIPPTVNKSEPAPSYASPNAEVDPEVAAKISTLPETLKVFLERDFETKSKSVLNLTYYQVLFHFNPKTSSRPSHPKANLLKAFLEDVRPKLVPFLIDPPAPETTKSPDVNLDFDPLHRRTTRGMLIGAILAADPKAEIRDGSRIDQLLILYKAHVDKDLILPANHEFTRKPMIMSAAKACQTPIENLRFAIQCHAPQIFVHSIAMTRPILANLYIKFVRDEKVPPLSIIEGYHYSVVAEMMDTEV
ncbi:uncharacterized protein MELLADRAFT_111819 [Melampsora larici-populina 98AG31]|uniref:Uncharacterized protein n=1 Tax=Melampsora larici-populina (strain 98AG31 / pathotype 3-4-7) TaxID=747676 RepID=F4S4G4_MELLP|nr:uncharacterized protein MELLADRAFT_111819 [Melampsora larici-populina 98AG31]EGG00473.1 hypothetical protein MELLADRAFT_111819 [Melampsora larici-populina 98AG31]